LLESLLAIQQGVAQLGDERDIWLSLLQRGSLARRQTG
jgi:hypothetical protein